MPRAEPQPDDSQKPNIETMASLCRRLVRFSRDMAEQTKEMADMLEMLLPDAAGFVPNKFQQKILDALAGKALRTDALGLAVGDRRRLFRDHGLPELIDAGLVGHHERLGYYRKDAPPPDFSENL